MLLLRMYYSDVLSLFSYLLRRCKLIEEIDSNKYIVEVMFQSMYLKDENESIRL